VVSKQHGLERACTNVVHSERLGSGTAETGKIHACLRKATAANAVGPARGFRTELPDTWMMRHGRWSPGLPKRQARALAHLLHARSKNGLKQYSKPRAINS
jgi:hypothetical protein